MDAPILLIIFRTYMSTMVAFFLISSSMIILKSIVGDAQLSTFVFCLKQSTILLMVSLYMNNSIAANNIKGNNMRRMISVDNVVELKLLDNDATEMKTIACKTTPSKMLRILLLYGFTTMCINATSMIVVSNET